MDGAYHALAVVEADGVNRKFYSCESFSYHFDWLCGLFGRINETTDRKTVILSEHGIYTKERKIDLFQAEWIRDNRGTLAKDSSEVAYFRHLWIRFFEALGRDCYHHADRIIALYETNRLRQIQDGAPAERTENIPNGINFPHLAKVRAQRSDTIPLTICLIGRVVPIKDIKTFIRALTNTLAFESEYPAIFRK